MMSRRIDSIQFNKLELEQMNVRRSNKRILQVEVHKPVLKQQSASDLDSEVWFLNGNLKLEPEVTVQLELER